MKKLYPILCLTALMASAMNANAQDTQPDYKALRTNTWSIYLQGGASWATGLEFKSVNPAAGISTAPEVGLGVNYNLRPWVRLGLNYEFSKYRRKQRPDNFEAMKTSFDGSSSGLTENTANNGGVAYRKMWNMYHNIDLTADFNIMQLWPNRQCTRFNLYAGTGAGMMFAKGNAYTLAMGNEQWEDPNNAAGNTDNWTSHTWLKAENSRHSYSSFYVPIALAAEYDVMPQLTLGVKGQYKALFTSDHLAPSGLEAAAILVRYNLVGSKQGIRPARALYSEALDNCNKLRAEAAQARQAEANNHAALIAVQNDNRSLQQQLKESNLALAECENKKAVTPVSALTVQFPNNSSTVSPADVKRLETFAAELKANETATINLTGEASAEGDPAQNQVLSEKRLANVLDILRRNGIGDGHIRSSKAIGDTRKVYGPSNRRVEITINQ